MPSFAQPPADLLVTDGYISLEEAFHVLGQHKYEAWDRDLALRHVGTEKYLSPNERAEDVRQHNLWVERYQEVIQSLLLYFRKGKPIAYALTKKGAVKSVNPDSWNGAFAMKALSSGGVYLQDGFLAAVPTAWQRQAALTQGAPLAEYGFLIVKSESLEQRIYAGRRPQFEAKREAESVFEGYLDELVAENVSNRIEKKVYLADFAEKFPAHEKNLTGGARKRIRDKIIEKHGATPWTRPSRPKKKQT